MLAAFFCVLSVPAQKAAETIETIPAADQTSSANSDMIPAHHPVRFS